MQSMRHPPVKEQKTGTAEDHAQQAYSEYNGGYGARDRYLQTRKDGQPADVGDRHFLTNYQALQKENQP